MSACQVFFRFSARKTGDLRGRLGSGTAPATTVIVPLKRPDPPNPATTRPAMNREDEVANPHINEPISNTMVKARNVHWAPQSAFRSAYGAFTNFQDFVGDYHRHTFELKYV